MEFDNNEVAQTVNELVWISYLWDALKSPVVRLAFEQTVKRLGGQVRLHPEPEDVWNTDLELATVGDLLVAKLPCGNAELAVDLTVPHKLMMLYDQYFDYKVPDPVSSERKRYDMIWDFVPDCVWCDADITTVTATSFDSFETRAANRNFQFVGYPWWSIAVNDIISQYERLVRTRAPRSDETVCFVLADVESPVKKDGNTILFPRDIIAGYWAKQFTLAAAALAITM